MHRSHLKEHNEGLCDTSQLQFVAWECDYSGEQNCWAFFFQLDVLLAFGQHLHAFTVFPISKMLQPHGDSDFLSSELLRF